MVQRFFRILFLGLVPFYLWIILYELYNLLMNQNGDLGYILFALTMIVVLFVAHYLVFKKWCIKHLFSRSGCCKEDTAD